MLVQLLSTRVRFCVAAGSFMKYMHGRESQQWRLEGKVRKADEA